jgi:hypothetical protein
VAAVDDEQELRWRSGEVESSGKREVSKMGVCKCKSKFTRSSRTCSGSRRRLGRVGAGAGKPAGGVAVRAAAARRGEAGRGPARDGRRRGRCLGGTWRRGERRGGGRCSAHGRRSGWVGCEQNRTGEGLDVDEGDLFAISQKCRDSTVKPS